MRWLLALMLIAGCATQQPPDAAIAPMEEFTQPAGRYFFVVDDEPFDQGHDTVYGLVGGNGSLAFVAVDGGRAAVIADGTRGTGYDDIKHLIRIRDGYAYEAINESGHYIAHGSETLGPYAEVLGLVEVNGTLASVVRRECGVSVVVEGQERGTHENVLWWASIADKLVYAIEENGSQQVIEDGAPGNRYDRVWWPTEFNGSLAYEARQGNDEFIVHKGSEGPRFDNVSWLGNVSGSLMHSAGKDGLRYVVRDGIRLSKGYELIWNLRGARGTYAAEARENGSWFVILGGEEIGREHDVAVYPVEIDGRFFYKANNGSAEFMVIDGIRQKAYDHVYRASAVAGHSSYEAQQDGRVFLVRDGEEIGRAYDLAAGHREVDGHYCYLAACHENSSAAGCQ